MIKDNFTITPDSGSDNKQVSVTVRDKYVAGNTSITFTGGGITKNCTLKNIQDIITTIETTIGGLGVNFCNADGNIITYEKTILYVPGDIIYVGFNYSTIMASINFNYRIKNFSWNNLGVNGTIKNINEYYIALENMNDVPISKGVVLGEGYVEFDGAVGCLIKIISL